MYETGSGLKPYLPKGETPYPEEGIPTLQPFPPHVSKTCSLLSFAISSPLPCLHHCPSCLHPVCKPFFLPFFICFPPSLATVGSSCSIKDSHKKTKAKTKDNSVSWFEMQPVTSHLVQIHFPTIILHTSVVYWGAACLSDNLRCALKEMLLYWYTLKVCTVFYVDEALKLPYKYSVFCNAW